MWHVSGRKIVIVILLALPVVLAGGAFGAPAKASTPEHLEQAAREAREKVERNRRCRPGIEKAYAVAIDRCKKRLEPTRRARCFGEAREQYFSSLSKCHKQSNSRRSANVAAIAGTVAM
jgi:hypothetical protein